MNFFLFLKNMFMCMMYMSVHTRMMAVCVLVPGGPGEGVGPLNLELQKVLRGHMGAGN